MNRTAVEKFSGSVARPAVPTVKKPKQPPAAPDPAATRREEGRLRALRRYDVLDTPPEESFDRLTRLAARHFDVPIALVSLVGPARQWPKSCYGADLGATDRELSFCHYAIKSEEVMVVPDTREDPRFAEAPFVVGAPHLHFYAGAPLVTPGGYMLGTFCLMDHRPRELDDEQQAALADFAAMAMDELELRREAAASAEARMQQAEQARLSDTLIDGLPGIFCLFDEEGQIRRWNDRFEAAVGYAPDEIRALSPLALTAEPEMARGEIQDGFDTGSISTEITLISKDDRRTPYYCHGRRLELDERPHLLAMGVDVTELRAAEAELREREERHRALVERASDVMTILGPDGTVRYESPSSQQVFGRPPSDLVGENIFGPAGIHPDDIDDVVDALNEIFEHPDQVLTVQYRMRHAEGHWIHLESTVRNLLEDEVIGGFIANTRDVTDSLRFEAEREARERAEELLATKTALLNNMSHEIRTPLAAIIGFAEVIEEEGTALHQEFAGRIVEGGERLQKTLDSVLQLARLESAGTEVDRQPVNAAAAAREAAAQMRPAAEEKDLALRVEAPEEAWVLLEACALQRILGNLLSNAVKFTEAGHVTVRVDTAPAAAREAEAAPGAVCLSVEDTGIGIGEAFQERLFEDFQQESSGLARAHEGSGLGLAITKRLVERMDGTIDVTSRKGEGTRFGVTFSAADGAPSQT